MPLTSRHLAACFKTKTRLGVLTSFILRTESGTLFVSASHALQQTQSGDNVEIFLSGAWEAIRVVNILHDPNGQDICLFTLERHFEATGVMPSNGNSQLGDRLLFVGFPHGLHTNFEISERPVPLVRTAFFSGVVEGHFGNLLILDGFNNVGYSGSPVFLADKSDGDVFGVVSGYRFDRKLFVENDDEVGKPVETKYYVRPNSGMVNVVPIAELLRVLEGFDSRNPTKFS